LQFGRLALKCSCKICTSAKLVVFRRGKADTRKTTLRASCSSTLWHFLFCAREFCPPTTMRKCFSWDLRTTRTCQRRMCRISNVGWMKYIGSASTADTFRPLPSSSGRDLPKLDRKRQSTLLLWAQSNAKYCSVPENREGHCESGYKVSFGKYFDGTVISASVFRQVL
jgi:hypothetical protein